jgi:oxygen-independent coproporphyrinogen-3 oxidase
MSSALDLALGEPGAPGPLLNSRYASLAANTIDYWMLPEDPSLTEDRIVRAIERAPATPDASLAVYIHVPFCAQRCTFCAFSGGNSLDLRSAERYARLVVLQLQDLLGRTAVAGHPIRSVNIGGGSPDLLGRHIGHVLRAVRDLPGCRDDTEVAVELTLSTTRAEFIRELVDHDVTKVSFGIQSLDPTVRAAVRQPRSLEPLDRVLRWIDGAIPVVNADLITGLPGQDVPGVVSDLGTLMEDGRIGAISSYLLTAGAAPSLLAHEQQGATPARPSAAQQAVMRLHTYGAFLRAGWVRKGTNTYVDPRRVAEPVMDRLAGNECIGARDYEGFCIGVGPQAVSSLPGVRVENRVDVEGWSRAVERGEQPFHLPKCSTEHQHDMGLWVLPLRWEGLSHARFDSMLARGALSVQQLRKLKEFVDEGLILHTARGYELSILGEVFMGHLVRDLKKEPGRRAVDEYIAEGAVLGQAIAGGRLPDRNDANNRQVVTDRINGTGTGTGRPHA